jgi:hypothetical protein
VKRLGGECEQSNSSLWYCVIPGLSFNWQRSFLPICHKDIWFGVSLYVVQLMLVPIKFGHKSRVLVFLHLVRTVVVMV